MAWRFCGRSASLAGVLVIMLAACGADSSTRPSAVPTTTEVSTSQPTSSEPTTASTSTTVLATSSAASATSGATGKVAYIALVRATEEEVADLYAKLGPAAKKATDEQLEKLRPTVCAAGFVAPDDNKIGLSVAMFIRGTAQQNPEIGKQWLESGILTTYERQDGEGGTFFVNIKWSDEVLDRLVAAQSKTYRAIVADHDRYCKDLTT
jgi:hypothetical protein